MARRTPRRPRRQALQWHGDCRGQLPRTREVASRGDLSAAEARPADEEEPHAVGRRARAVPAARGTQSTGGRSDQSTPAVTRSSQESAHAYAAPRGATRGGGPQRNTTSVRRRKIAPTCGRSVPSAQTATGSPRVRQPTPTAQGRNARCDSRCGLLARLTNAAALSQVRGQAEAHDEECEDEVDAHQVQGRTDARDEGREDE